MLKFLMTKEHTSTNNLVISLIFMRILKVLL
jgi:hypothetical protein